MIRILVGDVRERLADLPDGSVQCVVTSPPYFGLRDYGTASWDGGDPACDHLAGPLASPASTLQGYTGAHVKLAVGGMPYRDQCRKCGAVRVDQQIGLEGTLAEYIATLVAVFREVRRVLHPTGTCWLNLGDSYAGSWGNQGRKEERGTQRPINGPMIQNLDPYPQQASNTGTIRDAGLKPKDLMMVPARVAIALQDDGWYLRSDIIWAKKNCMPESVTDRPTSSHEHIFLLTKSARYFYDAEAVREPNTQATLERERYGIEPPHNHARMNGIPGQSPHKGGLNQHGLYINGANQRNVWHLATEPFPEAHFATFPTEIPRRCIKAGTSERGQCAACGAPWVRIVERTDERIGKSRGGNYGGVARTDGTKVMQGGYEPGMRYVTIERGWRPSCSCNADVVPQTVLDPFLGSGTTLLVADQLGRDGVGIELNESYALMAENRIRCDAPMFAKVETT